MRISARSEADNAGTTLRANFDTRVMSPCQYAPDGITEFDGDDPDAFFGPVGSPKVPPSTDPSAYSGP